MAKARAIVKRLKAVKNIRKITRTMELIATARYLEPLAMVWLHLAMVQKQGRQIAFRIVKR